VILFALQAPFLARLRAYLKKVTANENSDFLLTKRVENFNCFTLVGAIANDKGKKGAVANDGSPKSHQYVALADYEHQPLKIKHSGYLYCFPNDVWGLYENNAGSVQLTIERVL